MKELNPLGSDSARGIAEKLSEARAPDEQRASDAEQNPDIAAALAEEVWQLKFERESLWRRVSDLTEAERMLRADAEVLKNEVHNASEAERMLRADVKVLKDELREAEAARQLHANAELALNALLATARDKTTELSARIADLEKMIGTLKLTQYRSATENARLAAHRRLSMPLHWLSVRAKKRADWKLVRNSGSFDRDWYLEKYPDVRGAGIEPIAHYLEYGAAEGRDPSPTFSSAGYLLQNPDALLNCVNPLVHYLRNKSPAKPGGDPNPIDLKDHPQPDPGLGDIPKIEDLIEHFDPEFYLDTYPDILAAKADPLRHYFDTGWRENRNPTTWFVTADYLRSNADVAGANVNPFWHYLKFGQHEGRLPKNTVDSRRRVLEHLHPPDENDSSAAVPDQDRVTEGALRSLLSSALKNSSGLAVSFSHTSYIKQAAGTELFICDEQDQFNSRGFAYINLSPPVFSRLISSIPPESSLTRVTLNGSVIGLVSFSELARALEKSGCATSDHRIFIMHSPLGQPTQGVLSLLSAIDPTGTYYWVHDYSSVCTGYNLMRNNVEFCHAPPSDSAACALCIFGPSRSRNSEQLIEIFERSKFVVVAPSTKAREMWLAASTLPYETIRVKEHCKLDYSEGLRRGRRAAEQIGLPAHPVKVAFVGYRVAHKGWPLFERLVEATWTDRAYEFYHFGKWGEGPRSRRIRSVEAHVTPERRNAMVDLLQEREIDIVVLPSPWPETFSFVTFEALAAGCDVITLECSGNIAANVRQMDRGRVFSEDDDLLTFFTAHHAVELVRSRATEPNPCGSLVYCGTTASLLFDPPESP